MRLERWLPLTSLLILAGCVQPKDPLPEVDLQRFIRVYTQYMAVCVSDTARDEHRLAYLDEQLSRNRMTRAEFQEIRRRLEADPRAFALFMGKSDELLQKMTLKKPAATDHSAVSRLALP
ncbi:MAG TPA: hypothetical protein PLG50_16930 [bacterium]|nr:hypothetical protein [bacterium]HQG47345.1 hypothetical protein [bacterium]HQI48817.1 hypothetical protein [bacterium]HQJ65566.1 hypothetical protein [bacterium]